MIISDGLIVWKCHACHETSMTIGFHLQSTYLWANQYGKKVRFFCHACGAVYDVTQIGDSLRVVKHSMKCAKFSDIE